MNSTYYKPVHNRERGAQNSLHSSGTLERAGIRWLNMLRTFATIPALENCLVMIIA